MVNSQKKSKKLKEEIASNNEMGIEKIIKDTVKLPVWEDIEDLFKKLKEIKTSMDKSDETDLKFLLRHWDGSFLKLKKTIKAAMETNDQQHIENARHNIEMTIDNIKEDEYITEPHNRDLCKIFGQLKSLI
ncbi:MAG: hypothetical protein P1P85_02925 [Patescibacteria group bacterium]|nr:hypothetical protein [Patescibacteria group bacterium]